MNAKKSAPEIVKNTNRNPPQIKASNPVAIPDKIPNVRLFLNFLEENASKKK